MNRILDTALGFCSFREIVALAGVCASMHACERVQSVVRVLGCAFRDECCAELCANIEPHPGSEGRAPRGALSMRDTPIQEIYQRCASWYVFARMLDVARYFISHFDSHIGYHKDDVRLAACAICDAELVREFCVDEYGVVRAAMYCDFDNIAGLLAIQGIADASAIRAAIDGVRGDNPIRGYNSVHVTLQAILRNTHPAKCMTDCLECMVSSDVAGYREYLPHLRDDVNILREEVRRGFAEIGAFVVKIGPTLARFLLNYDSCLHHIATQFSRESPEFEEYMGKFTNIARTHWADDARAQNAGVVTRTINQMRAHLVCAARNPDARVFEWVHGALEDMELLEYLGGICTIRAWNCGEGIAKLRETVGRLEAVALRVNFDDQKFWSELRIDALTAEDAVRFIDFVLAHGVDVHGGRYWGSAWQARKCLRFCVERFGEPMRAIIASHGVEIAKI